MAARQGDTMIVGGEEHRVETVLKEDFFNRTLLLSNSAGERRVYKRARFFGEFFLFQPVAWFFSRRERRLLERGQGEGTPRLVFAGRGEFMTAYQPGVKLTDEARVNDAYCHALTAIVERLHAAGIAHNDLHKWENYLLTDDGRPFVMDFQLALWFPVAMRWRWWPTRPLMKLMMRQDRYHVIKKKKKLRPDLLTDAERAMTERSRSHELFFRLFNRPYLKLKRVFIPRGSNDKLWFQMKRGDSEKKAGDERG